MPSHCHCPTNVLCTGAKRGKGKQLGGEFAAELEAQWAKDRAKKATRKWEREEAKLRAALDPLSFSIGNGKGKGKGQGDGKGKDKVKNTNKASTKGMRAASKLDPDTTLALAPRAIVDLASLEAQLRRFVDDVRAGVRESVALPPMHKGMRKAVHEMAAVLGVKSVSKGEGAGRYTTLIGTSRTGAGVNEKKLKQVMKRYGRGVGGGREGGRGRGGKGGRMQRHKEGDEVGKAAPKIGESNIGFKMLASMGWSEGGRIGSTTSVGLEVPLTAIIKHSKLGLGATRDT